jgi:hypothetical protein
VHAALLAEHGLAHLDLHEITTRRRDITRAVAATAYDNGVAGVRFPSSRDGEDCYALFEHRALLVADAQPVALTDPAPKPLLDVASQRALALEPATATTRARHRRRAHSTNVCSYHRRVVSEPWIISPESHRPARACRRCGRTFSPDELAAIGPGWTPLHEGWRCPSCTRAHEASIERLARRLIAEHAQRRWLHTHEHPTSSECVFCDVIRRATALLLDAPRPSSARRNVGHNGQ